MRVQNTVIKYGFIFATVALFLHFALGVTLTMADLTDIHVREVSDGNMNRVFLVSSADGARSLAVPAIHGYDPENHALVMEDMSDLEVLRTLLNEGEPYGPHTSARIGEFLAQFSFATSDFGMPSVEREALVAASVSPEICKITEDVALSEPLADPRRHVLRRRLPGPLPAQGLDGVDRLRRHGNHPQNLRLRPPERPERPERPCRTRPRHPAAPSCSAAN
ncbi:hypothetical protein [Streptomyces sp. NPDC050121]|uniref:hypothetical protein n=1 Tax=Streptomyces sp. NPDC050121 TaxID=3365601 RepID=UPI00379BB571